MHIDFAGNVCSGSPKRKLTAAHQLKCLLRIKIQRRFLLLRKIPYLYLRHIRRHMLVRRYLNVGAAADVVLVSDTAEGVVGNAIRAASFDFSKFLCGASV